jgi:aryl-alcohol dehydrogenase-like predicted oxidoreductase
VRTSQYAELIKKIPPVIKLMQEIGLKHGDKTVAQVALNWLICKGALPIPGAKNLAQAEQNAGGAGWQLADEEVTMLDAITDNIREYSKG